MLVGLELYAERWKVLWVLLGTPCLLISTYLSQLLCAATCRRRKYLLLFLQLGIDTSFEHILSTCRRGFSQLWKTEYWRCKRELQTFTLFLGSVKYSAVVIPGLWKRTLVHPLIETGNLKFLLFSEASYIWNWEWDTYVIRNPF